MRVALAVFYFTVIFTLSSQWSQATEGNWPSFRGPSASGVSSGSSTAVNWDVSKSKNIRWKTAIPGLSHSSPIVWGNRVYITTAISTGKKPTLKVGLYGDIGSVNGEPMQKWVLYCLNKTTGDIVWNKVAHTGAPKVKRHPKSTHANSTPATDGKHIVAFFGSEGLYCYDMNGELVWKKDLGVLDSGFYRVPSAQWGFGSSPVIYAGIVIVQCDTQGEGFVAAFDAASGTEIWRTLRDDVPTWSTPTVHVTSSHRSVILNGYKHTGAYDFDTGKELWSLAGGGDIPVPTPIVADSLIFITSAHGKLSPLYAIKVGATGDISLTDTSTTNQSIVWSIKRGGAYMQTPIVYGDYLYNCRATGALTCFKATTGEVMYEEKLGERGMGFSASAVASDGKLYFTSESGEVFVVKAGPNFELLARNSMGEVCMATPAISEDVLYFRTRRHLVAVAQ